MIDFLSLLVNMILVVSSCRTCLSLQRTKFIHELLIVHSQ